MRIYRTTRYPWAYLVYGATQKELANLDASKKFHTPIRKGRKTPQRTADATPEARAALIAAGAPATTPPAVSHADWTLAQEEERQSEQWEATYGR